MRTEGDAARTEAVITGEMASGALGALKGDADGMSRHRPHVPPDHEEGFPFFGSYELVQPCLAPLQKTRLEDCVPCLSAKINVDHVIRIRSSVTFRDRNGENEEAIMTKTPLGRGTAKQRGKSASPRTCEPASLSAADGSPVGPSRKERWEGSAAMKGSPVVEATRGRADTNCCHFFLKSKSAPAPWLRRRVRCHSRVFTCAGVFDLMWAWTRLKRINRVLGAALGLD